MSYDKTKTFDRADEELGKKVKEKEKPKKKSWGDYFTEPIETLYIQMEDNKAFKYTSYDEKGIDLSTWALRGWLKRINKKKNTNYSIGNIKMILHNHLKDSKFSDIDHVQYRTLKGSGFKGHFLMYSHISKKIYSIDKIDLNKPKEIK